MSVATAERPITTAPPGDSAGAPVLAQRIAMSPFQLAMVALFCLFFMYHNYMPLFHSDLWGHVAYGDWILKQGRLPTDEPFAPLAVGVPVVDTAWLGQTLLALAERYGGAEGLSNLFAVTLLATYLVATSTYYYQTRHIGVAVASAFLVLLAGWSRHAIVRPECFGGLMFAAVIWMVARADRRSNRLPASFEFDLASRPMPWWVWMTVPAVFALWANLHGSFIVGFALLGCFAAGRALEVLWDTGQPWQIVRDREFLRWSGLTELAAAATLLNPLGIDLLVQTVMFPSHPNLKDIVEWFPLEMQSLEGIPMAFTWVLTVFLLRLSKARVTPADALLLLVFNAAVCLRVRMIAWYGPVLMLVLAPHLNDVCRQAARWKLWESCRDVLVPLFAKSHRVTLVAGLFVWVTFAMSPISKPVLGGKPRPDNRLYSKDTPLGVTAYLREHPPQGMVAAPQWWGDWLVWKGPPGLQVLMTTNAVHVVPPTVWKDYLLIAGAANGLERRLNQYRINTIVVCKALQRDMLRVAPTLPGWEVVFEDDVGLVAVRKRDAAPSTAPEAADADPTATEEAT